MDHPSCLGGRHARLDRPGPGLLFAGGEIGAQAQQAVGGADQTAQPPLAHPQSGQEFSPFRFWQLHQFRLHLGRNPHRFRPLSLRQGRHRFDHGVAAGQVVFVDVGGIDDRFGGQQAKGTQQHLFVLAERQRTGGPTLLQHRLNAFQNPVLHRGFLAGAQLLFEAFAALLHLGQIGQGQLQIDHLHIAQRIHRPRDVDDVVVFKATHHMDDGVNFPDVGQELVSQPFALAGPLDQAGDIDELDPCGDDLLGTGNLGELSEAPIGHRHNPAVGFDGAEGEIGGGGLGVGHQRIEEGGLAHVGQADDSGFKHGRNLRAAAPSTHHIGANKQRDWLHSLALDVRPHPPAAR